MGSLANLLPFSTNVSLKFTENKSTSLPCEIQDGFLSLTLPITYSFIFGISVLSNALAFWVFWYSPQRKISMTVYMRHLIVSDLLLSLCLPFRIAYQNYPGPMILCKFVGAFFYVNMYAGIMFLSLISLDRYLKIIKPFQQFRIHSCQWSSRASIMVWLTIFICALPLIILDREHVPCGGKCFHFREQNALGATCNIIAVVAFYILLLLFIYSYGKISAKLHKFSWGKSHPQARRNGMAVTKPLIVLAVFILCFVPYHVVRIPYILVQKDIISSLPWRQTFHIANELVLCIAAFNSCLDPIIYFFLSNSFRKAVCCIVQGKFKNLYQGTLPNSNKPPTEC
uniref:Probable G-protein coupled receptor 34 n=1 Tax=Geotrypetes seraphini TaxID=260995 RepID=A0A6P8RGC9_GEOSA|nr:probable G-protein coupled receptor 34 [Geotrypetes seraphini]XP_033803171.1 probable G-protein coupled receptor 34 [Geotrypetes seraphini]XP_033803172.1 probable G-protein coupled receptor 34 [Geotrypetes seraphini]XP_033803173.1 probable G-protein coupled receptor 34 [Geotrypetes seraphini]